MKTSVKIIIGLVLVLAAVCWYTSTLYKKAHEQVTKSPVAEIAKKQIEVEAKQISTAVKKDGLTHTIYKMVKEIDKEALAKVNSELLDTIDKLNITRARLNQVTVIATTLRVENQELKRKVGPVSSVYTHKDNHWDLSVNVPNDTGKKATFSAAYNADLVTAQYNKRKWLFFNDPQMLIYSNDPNFTNRGLKTLRVKNPAPFFGAKGVAKAMYNEVNGLSAGPGIGFRFGRLSLEGNYQYYFVQDKWGAGGGATYKLFGSD